jgi:3-oxoacyl-[acyl-carrier protein] reductase
MENQKPLHDKVAVVTGASRGIGRAIALRLGGLGATVVVHYKSNIEAAHDTVSEIALAGGHSTPMQADVGNLGDVRGLFQRVEEVYGHLDILVNNAGWADFQPLVEATVEHFDTLFNLNVRGLFFATQEAARRMRNGGRIINISSGITRINAANGSVYSGTKAAVEAFTRCWAAELGPCGITVNTVSPGMTETDLMAEVTSPSILEEIVKQTPLGRLGQPDDIASVVAFLCTDEARWLTAQNLLANGGA